MVRVTALNSPFLLGFDDIERALDKVSKSAADGYPPYNIERIPSSGAEPEKLRITLAVAGFSQDQIDVTVEENQLTIRGRQQEDKTREYLHRGIAARQFLRELPARRRDAGARRRSGARLAFDRSCPAATGAGREDDKDFGARLRSRRSEGGLQVGAAGRRVVMTATEKALEALTPQEFAHLGDGALAYVKTINSEDVSRLFPQAPPIRPGVKLFALLGADGSPILLNQIRRTPRSPTRGSTSSRPSACTKAVEKPRRCIDRRGREA